MKIRTPLIALLLAVPLAACMGRDPDAAPTSATPASAAPTSASPDSEPAKAASDASTSVGRVVQAATDKARREMAQGNFSLSPDGVPTAEITPDGHFLIAGKDVTTTAAQRAQMLAYRRQVEAIAQSGMAVGVAGADLGVKAAGEAIRGIFSGDTDGIEKRINAEADKLQAQAKQICTALPAMMAAQQSLKAVLPEFAPYATMTESDVSDCGK